MARRGVSITSELEDKIILDVTRKFLSTIKAGQPEPGHMISIEVDIGVRHSVAGSSAHHVCVFLRQYHLGHDNG